MHSGFHDWHFHVSQTETPDTSAPSEGYDAYSIQQKWQARWAEADPFVVAGVYAKVTVKPFRKTLPALPVLPDIELD